VRRGRLALAPLTWLALLCGVAHAEPRWTLRMATVAPEGTAWAREFAAFSRAVLAGTAGEVKVKWYLGGIGGSEVEVGERIKRGQLDGTAAGGMLCQRESPSMRVMRVRGLFNTRQEAAHVMSRLKPQIDEEFRKAGYVHLVSTGLGPDVVFSRNPIESMADLRKARFWRWDLDDLALLTDRALGMHPVPLPLDQAGAAYDEGRVDGFLAIPAALLAFQWYTRARYFIDLRQGFLWGCLLVSERPFDRLPAGHQQVLRTAAAELSARLEAVGQQQDQALLGGLLQKQGLKATRVTPQLRAEFVAAARDVRDRLDEQLVPRPLLERVLAMLADYRSEHSDRSAP